MMISKESEHMLCSLLFETTQNYNKNLQTLLRLIKNSKNGSIIVAPEVSLTGFNYGDFVQVTAFADIAISQIMKASKNKTVILTIIEKRDEKVYNFVKIFHNEKLVYERAKARLFKFGGEDKYFEEGSDKEIEIVNVDGIKIAVLVCFELRFKELWQKIEGADVITIPAWWGKLRTKHFQILTQSLALINQCYVVASDSKNEECTAMSGIITPQGEVLYNGNKPCLEVTYNKKDISLMRRYMDVGIKSIG
ncbi:nitrilase-related carbon-nitrogen hydrolase [Sulfurimonas sp.]